MKTKSPLIAGALRPAAVRSVAMVLTLLAAHGATASTLVTWGPGYWGQTNVPAGLTDVTAIAVGHYHVMALRANGTVVAWGGDGSDYQDANKVPPDLKNVRAISAGIALSLALKFDGTVVAWGYNGSDESTNVPPGLHDAVAIAAGGYHGLALRANGTVIGWGQRLADQIEIPEDLTNAIAIAAGSHHSLALRADGTVVAFGYNGQGQTAVPPELSNVIAIAAVDTRSFALKADGTVVQWGNNSSGAFAPPPGLSSVVAIAAGFRHTLALRRDGTVVGWGDEEVATVPPGLSNVAAIAANNHVNVALIGRLPVVPLIPRGAVWRYNDMGVDQGTGWRALGFNDAAWSSGPAQLGFGDGDEVTVLNRIAADGINPIVTAYFRRQFVVNDASAFTNLSVRLLHDDGAVVFVNGVEALRVNMPPGPICYSTFASTVMPDNSVATANLNPNLLLNGTNIVAVEVHQANIVSSDLSFELELTGQGDGVGPRLMSLAEALDAPGTEWAVLGDPVWFGQTNVTADGIDAACVRVVGCPDSGLETTVTGPGQISFKWRITEPLAGMGTFQFGAYQENGTWLFLGSRPTYTDSWNQDTLPIPAGDLTLYWAFYGPCGESSLAIVGYLDEVVIAAPSHPAPPAFVKHPSGQMAAPGSCITFEAEALSYPAPAYQWLFNGQRLAGVTGAQLFLSNVQTNKYGSYSVIASNSLGAATSEVARLEPFAMTLAQALDTTGLVWLTGTGCEGDGSTPWFGQSAVTHDGVDAAQGRGYGCGPAAWLETTVAGPAVVSFWWKTFTTPEWHEDGDFQFYVIDSSGHNEQMFSLPGNADWRREMVALGTGAKRLRWEAHGYCDGHDEWTSGWLDRVSVAMPPAIAQQPASQTVTVGSTVTFSVGVSGTPPFRYQWQKNGADLAGQTNATLTLPAAQITDGGTYRVRVVNEVNTVFSDGATLTVTPPVLARRSAPRDQVDPSVAANSNLYLVVWTDSRNTDTDYDIYGARVTASGQVLDSNGIRICTAPHRQEMPAVASDGRDFFVVWQDDRGNDNMMDPELYGTRVSADGVVRDPDGILISSAQYAQFYPLLVFNGTHYLVVWYDYRLSTESHRGPDIFGARVNPNGVVLDPGGIAISTVDDGDWAPTVASLNGDFMVVWGTSMAGVRGTRVTAAGAVVHPGGISISPYHIPNRAPLAANQTGYLAIWDDDRNYQATQSDIWGRGIAASGESVLPVELSICNAPYGQYRSALAASAKEFFCVWIDVRDGYDPTKIYATRITTNGVVTPNGFDLRATPPPRSYDNPAVASLTGEYLVVWPGKESVGEYVPMDIVGVRVSATGSVIDTNSFLISSVTPEVPTITWTKPADIVYGTALSSAQLNATASAPGSLRYVPPLGTLFHAGTHALSVFFTPYDTNAYLSATATTTLHVVRAPLTVTADDQTRYEGQVNPPLTATFSGLVAGDTPDLWNDVQCLVTSATPESPPATYAIEVLDFDPGNYDLTRINGTLTVEPARTEPGSVDLSFNARVEGIVYRVVAQPDGRILLGGDFTAVGGAARNGLARLHADGSLDPSFVPPGNLRAGILSIALYPDGRFMAAGFTAFNQIHHSFLARFNADGSRDATFPLVTNTMWDFNFVAVQGDGKALVAGARHDGLGSGLLLRFNTDGTADPGFNSDTGADANAFSQVAVQGDGRIYVCGSFRVFNGKPSEGVVRLQPDGSLDLSFRPAPIMPSGVASFALLPGGRIVIGGYSTNPDESARVARLTSDGALDPTFVSMPTVNATIFSMAVQSDGRTVIGGAFTEVNGTARFGLARLNANGSLDLSYDPGVGVSGEDNIVNAIAIQSPEFLLIGGEFPTIDQVPRSGLARVRTGGSEPPTQPFVTRHLSHQQVQLAAIPPVGTSVYAVEDQPPQTWQVEAISHDGTFDTLTGKVKFGPFYDGQVRTLSYEILPDTAAPGAYPFMGTASADGVNSPIGGDQHYVIAGIHPADVESSSAWHVTIGEVTAYGAAWRRGESWPVPPVPIPIDYVTRAAFLWRGGECYEVDPAATNGPLCWVNCGAFRGASSSADFHSAVSQVSNLPAALRQMPAVFVPGEPLGLTLTVTPGTSWAFAVEEQTPAGWAVGSVSDGGEWDAASGAVRWGPFLDNSPRTLSYQVVPTSNASAVASFSGVVSADGSSVATAGPHELREASRLRVVSPTRGTLTLSGRVGTRCLIETSTDLVRWTSLVIVTNATGRVEIHDPARGREPCRFYRARSVE